MASLKINIAANYLGKVWSAGITLVLIPLYIKFIGIESYGLIGFYSTLLSSFAILDFGLSTSLNRELARSKATNKSHDEVRNLVFSLECIYWGIGVLIALIVIVLAPTIGSHWIKAEHISNSTVVEAVMLMGAVIAFQWPINLYNGGLLGLEKQLLYNLLLISMTTIKAAGVFVVFIWMKPTVQIFFIWQAVMSLIHVVVMRFVLWQKLPKSDKRVSFSAIELKSVWSFAAGMTGIGVVTFFLTQIDKVILSKMLPLKEYGYYILAYSLASALLMLNTPICAAVFPRFSKLVSLQEKQDLQKDFHNACKLVSIISFPIGLLLVFFAKEILLLWTKNVETVQGAATLLQVLTIGSIFNCLINIPLTLLHAHGKTRYIIIQNTIAVAFLLPLLFWLVDKYGGLGAAYVWLILNAGYIFISLPIIARNYFKGHLLRWYINDTLLPFTVSFFILLFIRLFLDYLLPYTYLNMFVLGGIAAFVVASSLMLHPVVRKIISESFLLRK